MPIVKLFFGVLDWMLRYAAIDAAGGRVLAGETVTAADDFDAAAGKGP